MSWLALLLVPLALYLAYKLVGVAIKAVLAVVLVVALYWWAAPHMGWPTVSDLLYVFGPDFEGRRIEDVATPANLAREATGAVVDGVVEQINERAPPEAAEQAPPSRADDALDETSAQDAETKLPEAADTP